MLMQKDESVSEISSASILRERGSELKKAQALVLLMFSWGEIVVQSTFEVGDSPFFKGNDLFWAMVDQVSVMAGKDHRPFVILESPSKGWDRFEVEVVVGLI